jgi:toxin ParE1/3/4
VIRRRIRIVASARRDIDDISEWIGKRSGVDPALKWLLALDDYIDTIARVPGTGTSRSYLRPGLRSSPFFGYLVFFRASGTELTVVRVIHGASNYVRDFRDK